jgi:hypothetical protein
MKLSLLGAFALVAPLVNAQPGTSCVSACLLYACGADSVSNTTCLCDPKIYQSILACVTHNGTTVDFASAQQLEQQYCCNYPFPESLS